MSVSLLYILYSVMNIFFNSWILKFLLFMFWPSTQNSSSVLACVRYPCSFFLFLFLPFFFFFFLGACAYSLFFLSPLWCSCFLCFPLSCVFLSKEIWETSPTDPTQCKLKEKYRWLCSHNYFDTLWWQFNKIYFFNPPYVKDFIFCNVKFMVTLNL